MHRNARRAVTAVIRDRMIWGFEGSERPDTGFADGFVDGTASFDQTQVTNGAHSGFVPNSTSAFRFLNYQKVVGNFHFETDVLFTTLANSHNLMTLAATTANHNLWYNHSAGNWRFWDGATDRIIYTEALTIDTWYNVGLSRTGLLFELLRNGKPVGSYLATALTDLSQGDLRIGAYPGSSIATSAKFDRTVFRSWPR